jgi:hypothetical protein
MTGASLAVSLIGRSLAQARGLLGKHAIKQVDRISRQHPCLHLAGAYRQTPVAQTGWRRRRVKLTATARRFL